MNSLPPYPSGDLRQWAMQLVEYLMNRELVDDEVLPRSVLLQHKIGDERSLSDGLLMYDPQLGRVVIVTDQAWTPISEDVAYITEATFQDFSPADTYAPVPVDTVIRDDGEAGTYSITIQGVVTGIGGNATYQFRFTQDGVVIAEGSEYSLGNGEVRPVNVAFTLPRTGSGNPLVLEMRGSAVTFSRGSFTAVRVGQ